MNAPIALLTPRGVQRHALTQRLEAQRCTCHAVAPGFLDEALVSDDCLRHNPLNHPDVYRCERCGDCVTAEHLTGSGWCTACDGTCIYCGEAEAVQWCSVDEPCCETCHADHVCTHDDTCDDCRARWAGDLPEGHPSGLYYIGNYDTEE